MLMERIAVRGTAQASVGEVRLRRDVAEALGDSEARNEALHELRAMEETERRLVVEALGLAMPLDLEVVPDVPEGVASNGGVSTAAIDLLKDVWGFPAFRGGQ